MATISSGRGWGVECVLPGPRTVRVFAGMVRRMTVGVAVVLASLSQAAFADSMFLTNGGQAFSFVSEFTTSGTYLGQFANSLNNPAGIAQDPDGNYYVVNNGNNTVVKFQPNGTPVSPNPFISSNLSGAQTIALDQYGSLYVSQFNGMVKKFSSAGAFQMTFSATGAGYSISNAQGLWVDAQNTLYIADSSANNQVVMLNALTGAYINKINTNLSLPHGVIRDASGFLYVSNAAANNVAKFNPDYSFNSTISGGMSFPIGIGLDASGNLFVANNSSNTITKYNSSGTLMTTISSVYDPVADNDSIVGARWIAFKPYAVPEPSTYAMAFAGLGCGGYSMWRRRRSRRD